MAPPLGVVSPLEPFYSRERLLASTDTAITIYSCKCCVQTVDLETIGEVVAGD